MKSTQSPLVILACAGLTMANLPATAQTATETVLHAFRTYPRGAQPFATMVRDAAGNLYGTTFAGGPKGMGTLFKLDNTGHFEVLYSFTGREDGRNPWGGVVLDAAGNLYGTAAGGANNAGVVYRLSPSGAQTVLYAFFGKADGNSPYAGVILDSAGNLYGTTTVGGANNDGVVFKVDPSGTETVLHSFAGGQDGYLPYAGVIADANGNLYGTTAGGGNYSGGIIYKLDAAGQETILYSFSRNSGSDPLAGVIADAVGNLYGTTQSGGKGGGVIYELDAAGHYQVLHYFSDSASDMASPDAGLARDSEGNLYGTVQSGGAHETGAVFKLGTSGELSILCSFPKDTAFGTSPQLGFPSAGVTLDPSGNVFGSIAFDSAGAEGGLIFELEKRGAKHRPFYFLGLTWWNEPICWCCDRPFR